MAIHILLGCAVMDKRTMNELGPTPRDLEGESGRHRERAVRRIVAAFSASKIGTDCLIHECEQGVGE